MLNAKYGCFILYIITQVKNVFIEVLYNISNFSAFTFMYLFVILFYFLLWVGGLLEVARRICLFDLKLWVEVLYLLVSKVM